MQPPSSCEFMSAISALNSHNKFCASLFNNPALFHCILNICGPAERYAYNIHNKQVSELDEITHTQSYNTNLHGIMGKQQSALQADSTQ